MNNNMADQKKLLKQIIEAATAVLLGGEMPEPGSKADYLESSQHSPLTDPLAFRKYLAGCIADAVMPCLEAEATRRSLEARIDELKRLPQYSDVTGRITELKRQALERKTR